MVAVEQIPPEAVVLAVLKVSGIIFQSALITDLLEPEALLYLLRMAPPEQQRIFHLYPQSEEGQVAATRRPLVLLEAEAAPVHPLLQALLR